MSDYRREKAFHKFRCNSTQANMCHGMIWIPTDAKTIEHNNRKKNCLLSSSLSQSAFCFPSKISTGKIPSVIWRKKKLQSNRLCIVHVHPWLRCKYSEFGLKHILKDENWSICIDANQHLVYIFTWNTHTNTKIKAKKSRAPNFCCCLCLFFESLKYIWLLC